jgi:phage terminase small subunit
MGILTNPRHELFAQELAKSKSASEAYTLAGYRPCRQNAARLTTNNDIRARFAELQAEIAKENVVSIGSLLVELEEARQKASNLDQLSAAVRAIEAKAKISGLLTQRIEVTEVNEFAGCETMGDVSAAIARSEGVELNAEELIAFTKVVTGSYDAMKHFLASCNAEPVRPTMSQFQRLDLERKRQGLRRIGSQR